MIRMLRALPEFLWSVHRRGYRDRWKGLGNKVPERKPETIPLKSGIVIKGGIKGYAVPSSSGNIQSKPGPVTTRDR
jgi:hypothetical protein